jgi:hypothetical protein
MRLRSICLIPLVILTASIARAGDNASIADWLVKPILAPNQPLHEVQEYCESRVPPMPQVSSVEEWERFAEKSRQRVFDNVVFRGEAAKWRELKTQVEYLDTIEGGAEYHIRKLRYEAVPGMWIPALLYEPKKLEGKVPVVLNVNGHDRKNGKAADYKQTRCINLAKRGMLALNVEWIGMGQLQGNGNSHYRLNQLDLCGTSGLAPFYLSMSRGLDVLLAHEHADPDRVAVAGLSGGGWQTIVISALDERVTLSDPVAGYSSFRTRARFASDLGDSEQTPVDLGIAADYAQLTAMRAPRPTLLTFNLNDNCCFASPHALPPLMDAAMPIYKLYDKADHLRWHVNEDPGTHNFGRDNRQALYRMIGDFFYADDAKFNATELPCEEELKSFDELLVEVPQGNATLHSLARQLSKSIPVDRTIQGRPESPTPSWQQKRRRVLRQVVRTRNETVRSTELVGEGVAADGIQVAQWRLNISDAWTVPATVFENPGDDRNTVILLSDEGRQTLAEQVGKLVADGNRVITIDPFYFGESNIGRRDFLYGLLISAVGDRPLGIQAGQLNAVAAWATQQYGDPLQIEAYGPRTSLMTLVAAAIDGSVIPVASLHDSMDTLKDILTNDIGANQQPEMFCFGLLKEFDIRELTALAGPERIRVNE